MAESVCHDAQLLAGPVHRSSLRPPWFGRRPAPGRDPPLSGGRTASASVRRRRLPQGSVTPSAACRAARRWGTTLHHTHRPRRSPTISPASASVLVWWLTVGWDLPRGAWRSQLQTSSAAATRLSRRSRTGSERAANIRARSPASASPSGASRTDGQQATVPDSSRVVANVALLVLVALWSH